MTCRPAALWIAAFCWLTATTALAGEADLSAEPTATPASAGGSLLNRLKGIVKGNAAEKTDGAAPAPAASESTRAGDPIKIKTFDSPNAAASKTAAAKCKELVEPFGLIDSGLSLSLRIAQNKMADTAKTVFGTSTQAAPQGNVQQAARELNWMPLQVETQIGKEAHDKKQKGGELLSEGGKGERAYAAARKILATVLAQVHEPTPYHFTVYVTRQSAGGAEAAPGGFIYVDRDLLLPENEPRARFAIGHEIAHVLRRHQTRELQARLVDGIDSMKALEVVLKSSQSNPNLLLMRARDLKRLYMLHSEEQELQADACSVRLLFAMSPDKQALKTAIEGFTKSLPPSQPSQRIASQTQEEVIKELGDGKFSSHPNTKTRIQNLNTMVAEVVAGK